MKYIDMKMVTNMKKMKKHEKKPANVQIVLEIRSSLAYLPNNDQIIKT